MCECGGGCVCMCVCVGACECACMLHLLTQGVIGPRLEPVNSTTVDKRRKHSHPVTKCVPDRTEGQDDMKVLSTSINKVVEQRERCVFSILVLGLSMRSHCLGEGGAVI